MQTAKFFECIYCRVHKPATEFNAEHVVSRLLGTFNNMNTLVLNNMVCIACNDAFGVAFENDLARNSFEAIARYSEVGRDATQHHRLTGGRVRARLPDSNEEWGGLIVDVYAKPGAPAAIAVVPARQIYVKHPGDRRF